MGKSKSFWLTAVLLLAMSMFLIACGGDTTNKSDEPGDEVEDVADDSTDESVDTDIPEKPESLTMWVNDEEAQIDAYEEIVARFEEEYGITVNLTPYSMLDQLDGMSLDGPSGQGPDLFFQPHDRLGDVHLQGLAAELELTEDQAARLAEYNQDAVTAFSYDGIQYGIPAVVETYALFYNKELVPEAPETMDELMEIARDLTEEDTYGFLMEALNFYFVYPFLTGSGGYTFGQDANGVYDPSDIGLNNEGSVEGAKVIQSWFEEGLIPHGIDGDILNGLFTEGKAAMVVNGPWALTDYVNALGDNLGIAPLPKQDGEHLSSFSGNKGWLVNYYSDNQYWATELALFITNEASSTTYFEVAGELPAHTAVSIDDPLMDAIFEQTQYAEPMPNIPEMSKVWEPIGDALTFITQGDDPQEVLDEAVEIIKAEIEIMSQ